MQQAILPFLKHLLPDYLGVVYPTILSFAVIQWQISLLNDNLLYTHIPLSSLKSYLLNTSISAINAAKYMICDVHVY